MIPLAHAGHWILYLGPVVIVLAAVVLGALRERQRAEERSGASLDDDDVRPPGPAAD